MALLPLAGWAQIDISAYLVEINGTGGYIYNGEAQNIELNVKMDQASELLTQGEDFIVVLYASDGTTEVANATAVGNYYVAAKGINTYSGTTTTKVPFTISAKAASTLTVTTSNDVFTYDGTAKTFTTVTVKDGETTLDLNTDYTLAYSDNIGAGVGTAKLTVTGKGNYQGTQVVTFDIAKANIPNDDQTAAAPTAQEGLAYTGSYQNLVTAGTLDTKYGTIMYTVDGGTNWTTTVPQGLNAGNYNVSWKIAGSSNYKDKGSAALDAIAIGKLATKLRIVTIAKTKAEYDGESLALADATYSITGWAPGDNSTIQKTLSGIVAKLLDENDNPTEATEVGPNAGTYYVKADMTGAVYTNAGGEIALSTNYEFTIIKNAWTINRKALTITAQSQSYAFGTALPAIANDGSQWTVTDAVGEETPEEAYEVVYTGTYGDEQDIEEGVTDIPFGTYQYALKVQLQEGEDAPANYEVTLVDGDLTITGAEFSIFATVPTTVEYGEAIEPTYIALDANDDLATVDEDEIEYIYKDSENNVLDAAPTAIGTYTIEVKQKNTIGTGNFEGVLPECPTTPFSIVKKTLTINIAAIELWNGATKTILNQKATCDDYTDQLVGNEQINFEYVFKEDVEGLTVGEEEDDYAITFATEDPLFTDGTSAIEGKLVAKDGFDNDHYDVVWTGGELTATNIAALDITLAADDDELAGKLEDAANICAANEDVVYDVKFEEMPMAAKEWRAMVLPFEVTPAELVKELGVYVVVNTFKNATIDAQGVVTANFGIEMDKVAAGVPFLIKPAAAISWNEDGDEEEIVFNDKTIVGAPVAQGTEEDKATFTGTFNVGEILWWDHNLDGAENGDKAYRWLSYNGATKYAAGDYETTDGTYTDNEWKNPKSRPHLLSAMEAYLVLDPAATGARIFVEDFENGTTAIKELGVDGTNKAYSVDGWYTLDGIKLQSAPVEKGVYINNGKKVVLK